MNRLVPVQKRAQVKVVMTFRVLVFLKEFDSICDPKPFQHKNRFMCMSFVKRDPNTNVFCFMCGFPGKSPPMVIRGKEVDALNGRVCLFIYLCLVCAILSFPLDFSTCLPFNPPLVSVNVVCVQTLLQLGVVYITWTRI